MKSRSLLLVLALGCLAWGPRAHAAAEVSYTLTHVESERQEVGASFVFAAEFAPGECARSSWESRLAKIRRGGYTAVHLVVPWEFGQAGSLKPIDLEHLLSFIERTGMKAIVGPPDQGNGDLKQWFGAVRPVLEAQAARVLWLQSSTGAGKAGQAALAALAQENSLRIPVVSGKGTTVTSRPDADRPFREPSVAVALRAAAAEGKSTLVWNSAFAGVAPPPTEDLENAPAPAIAGADVGGLPLSYYEARLFAGVMGVLGKPVFAARPVPGASANVSGVAVSQRNAGDQGFLLVRAPEAPTRGVQLTFTDPATQQKMTVPTMEGLGLRTYGTGARLLPLNLPLPGVGRIRYSTAEIYGIYQLAGRTVVLVTDDQSAPNEIAFSFEGADKPEVQNSPAPPIWDEKTRTLTIGFVPSFTESFIGIGDKLLLGVVPTERAQRTWLVRAGDAELPLITSAYYVEQSIQVDNKVLVHMLTQQGSAAVTMLLHRTPRTVSVNGLVPHNVETDGLAGALMFMLRSPSLMGMELKVPAVQVLKKVRFQAGASQDAIQARPDYLDDKWSEVSLEKPGAAGWYRAGFRLPAVGGWSIPWKTTLQVRGKATVYLNGTVVGSVTGEGEKGQFVDVTLPEALLRQGEGENLLAVSVEKGGTLHRIAIGPWMEHAVQAQEMLIGM